MPLVCACHARAVLAALLGVSVAADCSAVQAQESDCLKAPSGLETTPGDGAIDVALDAPIVVRFHDPVVPATVAFDAIQLFQSSGAGDRQDRDAGPVDFVGKRVDGRLQWLGPHGLAFVPSRLLLSDEAYVFRVQIEGVLDGHEAAFTTGRGQDEQAPMLYVDEDSIDLSSNPAPATCELPDGTYIVNMSIPAAVDDTDNGALEYWLYLTRAQGLEAPRLLDRERRVGTSGVVVFRFVLDAEEVQTPVCTALRMVDGVGRIGDSEPEFCFDPRQGSFFQPMCHVSRAGSAGQSGAAPAAFLVVLLLARLRRRTGAVFGLARRAIRRPA